MCLVGAEALTFRHRDKDQSGEAISFIPALRGQPRIAGLGRIAWLSRIAWLRHERK
jgi:hypothetical protein